MRTLTAGQQAVVDGPITRPQYLVKIELDQPYYWSTRSTRVYDGNTYTPGFIQLGKVTQESCDLTVDNTEYLFTRGAQDGDYLRAPVEVFWAYEGVTSTIYVDDGYWDDDYVEPTGTAILDVIKIYEGVINATPTIGEWLTVQCSRTPPRLYPYVKLRPPRANHLPSAGYVLAFDGNVLRIEA